MYNTTVTELKASGSFEREPLSNTRERVQATRGRRFPRILATTLMLAVAIVLGLVELLSQEHWVHPEISGVVSDSTTSAPISGAVITVIASDYHAIAVETQLDGSFHIAPLRAWKYWHRQIYVTQLRIQKPGYYTERAETWHGYEEVCTGRPAPERYLQLALETQEDHSTITKRGITFFYEQGWVPPSTNNFRKAD